MRRLENISVDELQHALANVEGKTPTLRLIAAIAYKHDINQSTIADWFDVERKTIYNWLTRIEDQELSVAIRDKRRPGRPSKLSTAQWNQLGELLESPPTSAGYDAPAWTTNLVRQAIKDRFDVEYSRPTCRRLMKEAGLRYAPIGDVSLLADTRWSRDGEQSPGGISHRWAPR